jgi:hypothetical protein
MMRKIAAAGVLAAAAAGFLLTAAPAHADGTTDPGWPGAGFWNDRENVEIVPIQACRGIDVAGIGAALQTVLGVTNNQGPCVNGYASISPQPMASPQK